MRVPWERSRGVRRWEECDGLIRGGSRVVSGVPGRGLRVGSFEPSGGQGVSPVVLGESPWSSGPEEAE